MIYGDINIISQREILCGAGWITGIIPHLIGFIGLLLKEVVGSHQPSCKELNSFTSNGTRMLKAGAEGLCMHSTGLPDPWEGRDQTAPGMVLDVLVLAERELVRKTNI